MLALVAALNALVGPALLGGPTAASAADPCAPGGNKIACENSKPGTDPDVWDIDGAGDASIQGFATDISVNVGQRIDFKIDTDASAYTIDIYRHRATTRASAPARSPRSRRARPCRRTSPSASPTCTTELYDCGNWACLGVVERAVDRRLGRLHRPPQAHATATPATSPSSCATTRAPPTSSSRPPTRPGRPTTPTAARTSTRVAADGRAYKLSYNRPVSTRGTAARPRLLLLQRVPDGALPGAQRLRRQLHRRRRHRPPRQPAHEPQGLPVGRPRRVLERGAARQRRGRARRRRATCSSSAATRSTGAPATSRRPTPPTRPTAPWSPTRRPGATRRSTRPASGPARGATRASPRRASGGGVPENALDRHACTGQLQRPRGDACSAAEGKLPPVAQHLARHHDRRRSAAARAAHRRLRVQRGRRQRLPARRPDPAVHDHRCRRRSTCSDFGNTVAAGTTTHHLTLYKAPSGALVFSAGTVQWTWGLDAEHDSAYAPEPADARMQQAQVNLLRRHGRPADDPDERARCRPPSRPTPPARPSRSPRPPPARRSRTAPVVTVTGTAADAGGGGSPASRCSTDGGAHLAPGDRHDRRGPTPTSRTASAARRSGCGRSTTAPTSAPSATRSVDVTCPCSVFGADDAAGSPRPNDAVRASSSACGSRPSRRLRHRRPVLQGHRQHRHPRRARCGARSGAAPGPGRPSPTRPPPAGRRVTFATPVAVTAGQTYVVSYTAPQRPLRAPRRWAFSAAVDGRRPLQVDGGFGAHAGRRLRRDPGAFPTQSYQSANYFVDVSFTTTDDSAADRRSSQCAAAGLARACRRRRRSSATFSKPLQPGTRRAHAQGRQRRHRRRHATSYDADHPHDHLHPERAARRAS